MFREWLMETEQQMTPDGYRGILYLMKGTPGSGKSHLALRLVQGDKTKVLSTDDWFEQQKGGYRKNWAVDKLYQAHEWNKSRAKYYMQRGITPLAIDNTNLFIRQARPYVEMAHQYQYFPQIVESDSPWWKEIAELLKHKSINSEKLKDWAEKLSSGFEHEGKLIKSQHDVPAETIHDMLKRIEPYTINDVNSRIKMGVE